MVRIKRDIPSPTWVSSQVEIGSEAALDTSVEIARNHFVARRARLLRTAERAAQNGEAYRTRLS